MQDLENLGFNQATVSTVGCIVMILLCAYGQKNQIKKIWGCRKADRVSAPMSIIMCTLFAAYLIRGIAEQRLMFITQGVVRVGFFIPIIIGIIRFGNFTKSDWLLSCVALAFLMAMATVDSLRVVGFVTIIHIALVGVVHQAWSVRRSNGQVSFSFYLTSLASVSFQSWYGWHYNDKALLIPCLGFVLLYSTILVLMVRNLKTQKAVAAK